MVQYKPSQLEAIEHLNSNVIVPASAGAGKTAVLIARLMKRIIVDRVELDQICAMTFTEAAANEMKVRLMKALNEKFIEEPSDFITKQISLLETAHISTIHSFCLNIVKNYGYTIGINPDQTQNILPPAEAKILKEIAIKDTIDHFIETQFDLAQDVLNTFSANPLDFSNLEENTLKMAAWLSEHSDPNKAIQDLISDYSINSIDDLSQNYQDYFYHYYQIELENILENYQLAYEYASDALGDTPTPKQAIAMESLQLNTGKLISTLSKVKNKDATFYNELPYVLNTILPGSVKSDDFKTASTIIKTSTNKLMENHSTLEEEIKLINKQKPLVETLLSLAIDFNTRFSKLKKEKKALDFSDFEPMALEILLAHDGAVAKLLQDQFLEIMVDEFQDTNSYQDAIIRLISNGKNIFRVGDVKQAIYGFRGGKPEIMQSIINNNEAHQIPISYNFRSKNDIVNFNNVTFKNIMDLTLNSKYTQDDLVSAGTSNQEVDSEKVEFHIIETNEEEADEKDYDLPNVEENNLDSIDKPEKADPLSAYYISQEIIKLVSSGQYNYKDITILVRAHHLKDRLKEAFEAVNIPYFLNEQSGFYKSVIVDATISFLNYLSNNHDYDLSKTLLSPYFNWTLNDLAELRSIDKSLLKAIEISKPQVYDQLKSLKYTAMQSDVISLLQEIIAINDAYNIHFSIQDKTNIDALLDKAIQYQNNNPATITAFIHYLESLLDESSSEASPISSDEDVVTAMTIHQSKGLQFPVVFIFGLGRHDFKDSKDFLVTDSNLGIVLNDVELDYRKTQKTLLRRVMTHKKNHDALEESMRLLYVALTRAEKKMIIVDTVDHYKEERLDVNLLFKHKRKVNLLIPAAKDTAIVKITNRNELLFESLPEIDYEAHDNYRKYQPHFQIIEEFTPIKEDKALNLDRSHIAAMEYGTNIHEALENLPNQIWSEKDLEHYQTGIKTRLISYNSNPKTQEIYSNHTEFHHELPYLIRIDGAITNGIMDFVAISDDQVTFVDFKTDNADLETIKNRYLAQVEGYKKTLDKLYPGLSVKAYIYSFHLKDYISI